MSTRNPKLRKVLIFSQPEQEKEFVDDYERPELEKYDKMTPTATDRTKKQNGVQEVHTYNFFIFILTNI